MNAKDASQAARQGRPIRIAAASDVHCEQAADAELERMFAKMADEADLLVFCGDLTRKGLIEEARAFLRAITPALERRPVLSVLGNHDFESGREEQIWRLLSDAGVIMLDGNCYEAFGVGFTGIKGFGGGFGKRALKPWGETAVKNFVQEAIKEADKLDSAMVKLDRFASRIALLHYSPVSGTVEGEPPEFYPFLGSSHLEEPLNRHRATVVFHGHAHNGAFESRTSGDIPVFNVAMRVLKERFPDSPPFFVFEVPAGSRQSG